MMFSFFLHFFFYCFADHRDLHSFPTRRSSDLSSRCDWRGETARLPTTRLPTSGSPRGAASPKRSEEHTSELQSPYDIVCRLLLEKKKIQLLRKHAIIRRDGSRLRMPYRAVLFD